MMLMFTAETLFLRRGNIVKNKGNAGEIGRTILYKRTGFLQND
jgi:hypothetical protein